MIVQELIEKLEELDDKNKEILIRISNSEAVSIDDIYVRSEDNKYIIM